MQKKWTDEEIKKLEQLTKTDCTYMDIARKLSRSYDSIKHAVKRHGLTHTDKLENDLFFDENNPKKLTYTKLNAISRYIGEHLVESYKGIKLYEPKAVIQKKKRTEHSILDLSDMHIGMINTVFDSQVGKKVTTYNMEIFVKELEKLTKSIFKIHSLLRHSYNLKELTINVLGDVITNDRIFQEQVFEIEKCAGLQVWDAINYFTMFFNSLLKIYDKITIVCVVGNHGRSLQNSYNEPVENSFEYFIYKTWQKQFEDSKRINVVVPTTRRYVHSICGWKHLIEHGDLIRGSSAGAIEKQIKDLSLNMGGFDVMHKGHLHKLKEDEIADKIIVKHNGCWIEKDEYGFNLFKSYSVPKQWFFGCSEKYKETWGYKLDLRV